MILMPGRPPLVVPMCSSCKVPVEKFTIMPQSDHLRIRMVVECHGKTVYHQDDANLAIKRKWTLVKFDRPTFNSVRLHDPTLAR